MTLCPPASTRSRTRRAASARPRPPSTSPRASPRRASAACSSISTRRRTRPRGSACARTATRRSTCSTASRSRARDAEARSRTSTSCRRSRSSRPRPSTCPRSRAASATSPTRSRTTRPSLRFVFLDCPPSFGPLTVNALAAADRVIVPVQAEYYALEGLSQLLGSIDLVKRRLNPRLGVAGILLTMVDGRTRLAEEVERELRSALRRPRLHPDRAPLGAPRRGAEPRAPRDRLRPALAPAPRPTGRWRWSLSSAPETPTPRRGLGRGLEVLVGGAAGTPTCSTFPSTRSTRTHASRAAGSSPRRPRASPRRSATRASCSRSSSVPAPEGGYELVAGERRWRAAREAGLETLPALVREADDRDALLLGARRERRPREPFAGRGGARLRVARRRVRALARRGRRAGRAVEAGRLEPAAAARAPGGGALDARARRAHRGSRPRSARASPTTRRASGSPAASRATG